MASVASRPQLRFSIRAWSAWAPGLVDADAWRRWALQPCLPTGEERPELPQYPMLLRRRAERLARMALHTVSEVRGGTPCPMVYASQRGETQRAVPLLRELAEAGTVAPGPFSLSVHNAVAALESIANADTGNYTALAAAGESTELAIIEALGLLTDGYDEVIVSVYDETVPDCYRADVEDADAPFAWSWRVALAGEGPGLELSWEALGIEAGRGARGTGHGESTAAPGQNTPALPEPLAMRHTESVEVSANDNPALPVPPAPCPVPPSLPPALRILQFFLSDAETLSHDGSHCRWTWRRLA